MLANVKLAKHDVLWIVAGAVLLIVVLMVAAYREWDAADRELARVHRDMHAGPQLLFFDTETTYASTVTHMIPAATGTYGGGYGGAAGNTSSMAASGSVGPGGQPAEPRNRFARVRIANDPGESVGECARRVVAMITFLDDAGSTIFGPMTGRWAETPQRAETGRLGLTLDESQIDIDANGLPHPLDVAMKVPGEKGFYAFNHENSSAADLRLPPHRLTVDHCRVRVVVRPANGRATTATFVLSNTADDLTLNSAELETAPDHRPAGAT